MVGFLTKSGSEYFVNLQEKSISGGILGEDKAYFDSAQIIAGCPAIICMKDGRRIKTSVIVKIL